MRGIPLRCPYHLYTKKNKSVSCFFLLTNLLYEEREYETESKKMEGNDDGSNAGT